LRLLLQKIIIITLLDILSLAAGDLYVFAPTFSKTNTVEKELISHSTSGTVKVFGRFSDFKAMIEATPPDVLVAPAETIRFLGLSDKIRLRGIVKGQLFEPMVLVSMDHGLDKAKWPESSIGYVATADRAEGKRLLESRLGIKTGANPTTKLEDLLPLLTFQSAQAVLVSASQAAQFKQRSQANLVLQPVADAKQETMVVVLLNETGKGFLNDMMRLPQSSLELLSVEGWK